MPQGREADPIHGYRPMSMDEFSETPPGEPVPQQQLPKAIVRGREGASQWGKLIAKEVQAGHGSPWAVV